MSKAAELAALIGSQTALSNRNLIINGAMQVAQRGTSFALTSTESYTLDRFIGTSYGGNTVTFSQDTDVPSSGTFTNSLKATNSGTTAVGASGFYSFRHKIEGFVLRPLRMGQSNAQSFTVSFWVKSSIAPSTHTVGIINGALNRANRSEFTISSANTWEYKTVTFQGDTTGTWATDNTNAMYVDIVIAHGSGNTDTADTWTANTAEGTTGTTNTWPTNNGATFYATGIQLELGEQDTPFEHRSYGDELARCQRYFEKSHSEGIFGGSTNRDGLVMVTDGGGFGAMNGFRFTVAKRASPTMTGYSENGTSGQWSYPGGSGAVTFGEVGTTGVRYMLVSGTSSSANGHFYADAEL